LLLGGIANFVKITQKVLKPVFYERSLMQHNTHLFAFLLPNLTTLAQQASFKIDNEELIYRLFGIVRKHLGDQIILFDDQHHAVATLIECSKRFAVVKLEKLKPNLVLQPELLVAIGLTKKPAFEEALYSCAAMGVNQVVPLITEQVDRNWFGPKEIVRLDRIVTTAREQAKNYMPLEIMAPLALPRFVDQVATFGADVYKLVFDKPAPAFNQQLPAVQAATKIVVVFGPEGGLLPPELQLLESCQFVTSALVSTTLRTQEAVTVAIGVLRSLTLSQNRL
jgi:16S rRNA (uracil1498-N3)-methyltransferase